MKQILRKIDDPGLFWEQWEYCVQAMHAGPRYSRRQIENLILSSCDRGLLKEDLSFVMLYDGKAVAAVLLPCEEKDGRRSVTFSGDYVVAPLIVDPIYGKETFRFIDQIAKENGLDKVQFAIDPLSSETYNFLQKFGYLDTAILGYCINLTQPGDLLQQCRRGHKCDIKKLNTNHAVKPIIVDATTLGAWERHEEYRELHRICSGRITRAKETFDKQFELLQNGEAVLVGLLYNGVPAAYAYFQFLNGLAVYASGADNPEFCHMPLYHSLLYHAMCYLKGTGVRMIDTGQPSSPSKQFGYFPDTKQLNIALFKRGFGGDYRPYFRGIKYYSSEAFSEDERCFAQNYFQAIKSELLFRDNLK
jgi:hypothetical protein